MRGGTPLTSTTTPVTAPRGIRNARPTSPALRDVATSGTLTTPFSNRSAQLPSDRASASALATANVRASAIGSPELLGELADDFLIGSRTSIGARGPASQGSRRSTRGASPTATRAQPTQPKPVIPLPHPPRGGVSEAVSAAPGRAHPP